MPVATVAGAMGDSAPLGSIVYCETVLSECCDIGFQPSGLLAPNWGYVPAAAVVRVHDSAPPGSITV